MCRLLTKIRNFFFCKKYPFYKLFNVWTGKFSGYDCTWYDDIPEGWRKAFGKQLTKDLYTCLKKYNHLHDFHFVDIKEKWGSLRLAHSLLVNDRKCEEELDYITAKYEFMSYGYCIHCGKPARHVTHGWVSFICDDCAHSEHNHLDSEPLTEGDIPYCKVYDSDKECFVEIDLKEKYGIDFKELWGLNK